jgi:hypothetical protein
MFTRFAGLGLSAWFVVAAQSIIVVYMLDKTCEYLLGNERRYSDIFLLASVSILTVLSSLPWLVSQLMPDVFAGLVFLSSFLLVFHDQLRLNNRIYLAAILMVSAAVHTSLLPIAALFVVLLITIKLVSHLWRTANLRWAMLAWLLVPLIAAGLSTATLNFRMHLGFTFSPSRQLFMLSRLFADGLAEDYLRENCPMRPFLACGYLSNLPRTQTEFLFENRPLLRELTRRPEEMDGIVQGTLSTYKLRFLTSSLKQTLFQFAAFRTGDEVRSFHATAWDTNALGQVFPGDYRTFLNSREIRGRFLSWANAAAAIDTVCFWVNLMICTVFVFFRRTARLNHFFYVALAFLLINAGVCATFSGVFDRYQSRVAWLPTLCATAFVCDWLKDRLSAKKLRQEIKSQNAT